MKTYVVSCFDFINSQSASAKRIRNIASIINGDIEFYPYTGTRNPIRMIAYFNELMRRSGLNNESKYYFYPTTKPLFEIIWLFYVVRHHLEVTYDLNERRTIIARLNLKDLRSVKTFFFTIFRYPLFYFLEKMYKVNKNLIVISKNLKEKYEYCTNCIYIPSLVKIPSVIQSVKEKPFRARLGYFGAITLTKEDFYTLFKAMSILKNNGIVYELTIYGYIERDRREFKNLINHFNLDDQVVIRPFIINETEVMERMIECDLLVLLRRDNKQTRYSFSTKLAEYMLSGTPVLTSSISDYSLYVENEINGFIFKASDVSALVNSLENIHKGKYKLASIGKKAQNTAISFFDAKVYTQQINQ